MEVRYLATAQSDLVLGATDDTVAALAFCRLGEREECGRDGILAVASTIRHRGKRCAGLWLVDLPDPVQWIRPAF